MIITYIGGSGSGATGHTEIKGKNFYRPDDFRISLGTYLKYEDKQYWVWWSDCSVIYDDENINKQRCIDYTDKQQSPTM